MKISKSLLPAAALVALFAGCQDEDMGFTSQQIKNAKYDQEFQKAFGEIDPNQDWSMAKQVTATISGAHDGVLEIFYRYPLSPDAVLLARKAIVNGEATVKFDAVKNVNRIYARVNAGNGYFPVAGFYDIVDGTVNIGTVTRAETFEGTSRVTKSDVFSINSYTLDLQNGLLYFDPTPLVSMTEQGGDGWLDGRWMVTSTGFTAWRNWTTWGENEDKGEDLDNYKYFNQTEFSNLYRLYNVLNTQDERPQWNVSDIAGFFTEIDGRKPAFTEKVNHVKLMVDGSVPHLEKDLVFTIAESSPVYLDYFAKGTEYDNEFGYFYYTGDMTAEKFKTVNKYILLDNASTSSGTVSYSDPTDKKTWTLIDPWAGLSYAESTFDNKVTGTRLPLTYFGEDGTSEGVYEFPAGTKIGFFFLGRGNGRTVGDDPGLLLTSISSVNLELYNETPHAAVFRYNDNIIYSMEDQTEGSDHDINDIMFIVNGSFTEDIPDIDPVDPVFQSWVIACEDLGGSFDYDFNDLVFAVSKELDPEDDTKANLTITGLAAGGTLDAKIKYGDVRHEIHSLFGAEKTSEAINVEPKSSPEAGNTIILAEDINADLSIEDIMRELKIVVTPNSGKEEDIQTSDSYNIGWNKDSEDTPKEELQLTPQVLILPQGWDWPAEGTLISDVYPGFAQWAGNTSVDTWIATKVETADYVNNPMKPVVPDVDPDDPDPVDPVDPVTPTYPKWNVTMHGEKKMEANSTQKFTFEVAGVDDLSTLDITAGVYSTVLSIVTEQTDLTKGEISIKAPSTPGTYRFYIKIAADETHSLTRLEYPIEVVITQPVPEFTVSTGHELIMAPGKEAVYEFALTQGKIEEISVSSDDESVAKIDWDMYNTGKRKITAVGYGTTTLHITHAQIPFMNEYNPGYAEKDYEIKVTVKDPEIAGDPAEVTITESGMTIPASKFTNAIFKAEVSFNATGYWGGSVTSTDNGVTYYIGQYLGSPANVTIDGAALAAAKKNGVKVEWNTSDQAQSACAPTTATITCYK